MRLGKIAAISLFLIMLYVGMNEAKYKYCGVPLVRNVKVHRITASSGNSNYQPSFAKFGNVGWSPSKADLHPWLKIDLGDLYLVCGFKVQGCRDGAVETYVRRYRVQVSPEDNFWDSWNYIKPEFYAGKSAKEVAYSEAKERKVGRFVKIYPVSYVAKKSKHHSACMKVEIYGNPYLSNGQHVFVRSNWAVMTYEKMKIQAIVPHAHTVDVAKGNQLPQRRNYYPHFSEVIPQVEPLQTELRVNTCVIAPVKGQYFSGRVHEIKDGRYRIEMLLWANREKLWRAIRLFDCKREELQIVFSAWCEKIDFVARVNHKDRMLTGGQIVRIDSQLQFIKNVEGGLYQLSYHRKNMTIADFVSRKKVEPDKVVPGVTKLWVENYQGYLEPKQAPSVDTANWIRWRNVWYRENGDKPESCHIRELQKGQCCYSRIPFTVVRQNCSITYAWNGERCTDEDECITGMASCGLNALCANTPGFYKCFCSKGFTGNSPRTAPCNDVDECAKKVCHKDAICKNTVGSFTCRCKKGFKGDGHKSCVDIDECKVPADESPCEKYKHAHCKNLPGSFRCECKTGFQGSFKQCEDLDECSSNRHNCSTHADCTNAMGSYNCNCKKGYTGDGTNCQDIKECNDQTNEGKCHPSLGQCVDIPGGYKCECKEGYVGDGIKSCILANECELGIHSCHKEATCINTRKSYVCRCNKGFEGDGRSCKDIDECVKKDDYCGLIRDGIECVNTDGSYKCICAKGFTEDGKTCVNIDECKTGAHNCVKDAICTDTKGGFYCRCRKGFYGDPTKECQPESGCMKALPHCDVPRAICTTEGKDLDKEAFSCFCKSGFTGANSNCTDIDECVDADANKCSKDALCINTAGTYECRCKDGLIGDGFICSDVNECNNHTRCPENAMCVNMKGSFECRCKTGFYGQDPHKQCSDVDECSQNNKCGYSSQACVNTVGSFYCKCKHGFKNTSTQAKLTCEDIDECVVQEESCGTFHSITCKNTPGDYFCVCEDGFEFTRKKQKCEDINECDFVDYPCVNEATCINNVGGFECACPKGYHGNGKYFCDADSSTTNKADGSGVFSFMISVIIAMAMLSTQ